MSPPDTTQRTDGFVVRYINIIMLLLLGISLLVTATVIGIYVQTFGTATTTSHNRFAEFGEYFGGVAGSTFALFALVSLLITLHVQTRELRLSSDALASSAKALTDQNSSIKHQSFESRLFRMLSLHHEIVNGIQLRRKGAVTAEGRDALNALHRRMLLALGRVVRGDYVDELEGIRTEYDNFYALNSHKLAHYFRNLYRIIKFIDNSSIESRSDYIGLARAQLSNQELGLLFYNCLAARGARMKRFAEAYVLFDNLEDNALASATHKGYFDSAAFGNAG